MSSYDSNGIFERPTVASSPIDLWIPLIWSNIVDQINSTEADVAISIVHPLWENILNWTKLYPSIIRIWFLPDATTIHEIDSTYGFGFTELIVKADAFNVFQRFIISGKGASFPTLNKKKPFAAGLAKKWALKDDNFEQYHLYLKEIELKVPPVLGDSNVPWKKLHMPFDFVAKNETESFIFEFKDPVWGADLNLKVTFSVSKETDDDSENECTEGSIKVDLNDPYFRTLFPTGCPSFEFDEIIYGFFGIDGLESHFFHKRLPDYHHLFIRDSASKLYFGEMIDWLDSPTNFLEKRDKSAAIEDENIYFDRRASIREMHETCETINCMSGLGFLWFDLCRILFGTALYRPRICLECRKPLISKHAGKKRCGREENIECHRNYERKRKQQQRNKLGPNAEPKKKIPT